MKEKTRLYFDDVAPRGFFDKIFRKSVKATVSTTMFIDYSGDQFPVRNITSVQIRYKPTKFVTTLCKWLGSFLLVAGSLLAFAADTTNDPGARSFPSLMLLVGLFLIFTWLTARVFIVIGAGGITQDCYPHRIKKKGAEQHVKRLATAINNAISDLQNK